MRKYFSFLRIRFINGLQYRAAAYAGISTQFAFGFMFILMYEAFFRSNISAASMTMPQLATYIWLTQAFLMLFNSWSYDNDIMNMITSGNVAYEMCRPVDIYTMWFVKNVSTRTAKVTLRCLPILIFAVFLPANMRLSLPDSFLTFGLFLISMFIGFMLVISFTMLIYITIFYTISPLGTRIIVTNIVSFLSGELIPLPLYPDSIRKAVELLPFASMHNTPFLIYNGAYKTEEAIFKILMQLFWFLVLVCIGKLWIKRALRRVVVQGG
ncbi:MAG: ABC transporter permease [Oscillospiraceae bacterium]|nr:ABC transporter permease [Oscillospiraceae bacterium]